MAIQGRVGAHFPSMRRVSIRRSSRTHYQALRRELPTTEPRLVAIGGGSGLSTLLRGIKEYTSQITAIVAVTDDGGSSGRLRAEMGVLPPGDIRNCLVALADAESLMNKLFQYRFDGDSALSGHSFGNLFIAAMTAITGDFERAVQESSRVLSIRGSVIPATLDDCSLRAQLSDGTVVSGETKVSHSKARIERVYLHPENCAPVPEALEAIGRADAIIVGPGSLYTSIMPVLLVPGISQAIRESAAIRVFVCNVMTQPGETDGYSAYDHVKAVYDHVGSDLFDIAIVNAECAPETVLDRYILERASQVGCEQDSLAPLGLKLLHDALLAAGDVARHDPAKLAAAIMSVLPSGT